MHASTVALMAAASILLSSSIASSGFTGRTLLNRNRFLISRADTESSSSSRFSLPNILQTAPSISWEDNLTRGFQRLSALSGRPIPFERITTTIHHATDGPDVETANSRNQLFDFGDISIWYEQRLGAEELQDIGPADEGGMWVNKYFLESKQGADWASGGPVFQVTDWESGDRLVGIKWDILRREIDLGYALTRLEGVGGVRKEDVRRVEVRLKVLDGVEASLVEDVYLIFGFVVRGSAEGTGLGRDRKGDVYLGVFTKALYFAVMDAEGGGYGMSGPYMPSGNAGSEAFDRGGVLVEF